jgi:hypothetical protein
VDDDSGTGLPAPDLPSARFGREGYVASQVDDFLAGLERALRNDPPTMAPYEVDDQRFTVKRFGRTYALREVDDYLDLAREHLGRRHGTDAVAGLGGSSTSPKHFPTIWIYLVAFVVIAAVIGFAIAML